MHPRREDRDGPLPPLMLLLTMVTGFVDATSYLRLGHVFVANMTGNVVFLGFAVAGARGLSAWASLAALAAFVVGGVIGGRLGVRFADHRGRALRAGLSVQLVFLAAAAIVGASASGGRYPLIALLGVGMGVQNATVRRLGVREFTTTVLTMTLTGIAADSRAAGGPGSGLARRSLSVVAMALGALFGALLVLRVSRASALGVAAGLVAVTAVATHLVSRAEAPWTSP